MGVSNGRVSGGVRVAGAGTAGGGGARERQSLAPLITVSFGAKSGLNDA